MEHEKFDAALEKEDLFSYNEERANHYAATCLKFAAIVMADVSGKGVPAALFMVIQIAFRQEMGKEG